ncbi:LPXTG cell wall anchor domain-containing protein [Agrococcus jejuensis]|uniref:LPXTG cell wall anchor domain-containing protein n=1 Tax=Agrococcus jejuensis TaxID=399736 RepID=UPI0011A14DE9|nr:LPXTG cell wall anchor domain-containing protein [Agrococcus jejuensis]
MPRPLRRAMSAGLVTLLATAGVVGLGASVASADSTQTFSGTLQAGDGTWQRPNSCVDPTPRWDTDEVPSQYYDAQTFTVPESGGYELEMTAHSIANDAEEEGADGYFYLYEGGFDPANTAAGCITQNDDGTGTLRPLIEANLQAGVTYTLVTTQYFNPANESVYSYATEIRGLYLGVTLELSAEQARVFSMSEPVDLLASFSEPVVGFDADDVSVSGPGAVDVTVSGSGADYAIELSAPTVYGTYRISVGRGAAVSIETEEASQPSQEVSVVYAESIPTPTVTVTGMTTIVAEPAVFQIEFSEPVEGLESSDVVVGGTAGATTVELAGEGALYTVTVTGFAQAGTVEVSVPEGAAYAVLPGGEGPDVRVPSAASNTATITYAPIVAEARPTVTVEQAAGQADPTSTLPVAFDVTFSEPIDGLETTDVQLGGTAGSTRVAVEALAGEAPNTSYRVTVLDAARAGTISVSIPAGAVVDQAGLGNLPSTSVDNVVTYAVAAPPAASAGGTLPQTGAAPGWLLAAAAMLLVATGAVAVRRSAVRV